MVRVNKIGRNFGLKCELREYRLPARLAGLGCRWAPQTLGEGCWTPSGEVGKHTGQGGVLEGERALSGAAGREAVACEPRPELWKEACPGRCRGQNPSQEGGCSDPATAGVGGLIPGAERRPSVSDSRREEQTCCGWGGLT